MLDYALFRLPDANEYHVVRGHAQSFGEMPDMGSCKGFVMAPFTIGDECPFVVIPPEKELTKPMPKRSGTFTLKWRCKNNRAAYHHDFLLLHQLLASGSLDEVALSRRADCKVAAWSGTLAQIFQRACRLYPHLMVALVYTRATGAWLVATPEKLRQNEDMNVVFPSPSTCGLPREKAVAAILQNESIDRRYHGGVCGPWGIFGENSLYVSQTCMEMRDERNFRMYAGSRLLKGSAEGEGWRDTRARLETMKNILG